MSDIPAIDNLLISGYEIDSELVDKPTPLTKQQLKDIKGFRKACSNSQQNILSGLRFLSNMIFNVGDSCSSIDCSDLIDLSSLMEHLTDEMESISGIDEVLDHRLELAHQYSNNSQRMDELEIHKESTAAIIKCFNKDIKCLSDKQRKSDYLDLLIQYKDLEENHPELVKQGETA